MELWLVRHGETEWSRDHKHTSVTDLPLTENGVAVAKQLAQRLHGQEFDLVLTSPRERARRTAELAGFGDHHGGEPGNRARLDRVDPRVARRRVGRAGR